MSNKKLLIANNEETTQDNYTHYLQIYTGYPLVVESDKLCADHPSYIAEIYGNTTQDEANLTDIRSVGVLQEDGTYKVDIIVNNQDVTQTQIKSIYLPQPLRAIGNYSDKLYWDSDLSKYCIEQNISNIIFDGSDDENWLYSTRQTSEDSYLFYIAVNTLATNTNVICDFLTPIGGYTSSYPKGIYLDNSDHSLNFRFPIEIVTNDFQDDTIAYMQENPITVWAAMTDKQIVETDIIEKLSINTYENYIQITTDELEVAPTNISGEFANKEAIE